MARVTVVGSCNIDLVTRTARFPRPGEHLIATDFGTYLGGKGANQAVASSRAGAHVKMVGSVGDDDFGAHIIATLATEGIDVGRVRKDAALPTGNASIWLDERGENQILVYSGANQSLAYADATDALSDLKAGDVVLMQLEVPMPTVLESARLASSRGAIVVLNAAPAVPLEDELWRFVTVLVVNETEAAALSNGEPPVAAALALLGRGCGSVVVTLGQDGCIVATAEAVAVERISAFAPVRVVDATGAGDAFCGVLAAKMAAGSRVVEAARWGNAAGSLAVEVIGAIPSMPSKSSIERRVSQAGTKL